MGNILYIYTHNEYSAGAKALSRHLLCKRIRHTDSQFKGGIRKTVLNWGATDIPCEAKKCLLLNSPEEVLKVSNKLTFFKTLQGEKLTPAFTTDKEIAKKWASVKNKSVVCRLVLNGSGGRGIRLARCSDQIMDAPLYTKYVPKKDEYRVHIFQGEIIDVQKKTTRHGVPASNYQIRNQDSGFIYIRMGINPPAQVEEVAFNAFNAFGLHFGTVDVIWTENTETALALEINTAPGLEGETVEKYADAIREYL